ncbi:hypothetical protein [Streptomyces sp. CBMA156]|nr:hypothetical protein [Streptomyces sp. CBMA156]
MRRDTAEGRINRLNNRHGLATCHEKAATFYAAGLHIFGIFIQSAR